MALSVLCVSVALEIPLGCLEVASFIAHQSFLYPMERGVPPLSHKRTHLAASGTLHPTPEKVQAPLFPSSTFFAPDDALQVKYAMLRRVAREGHSVTETAQACGVSRRHFYALQHQFAQHGFQGLVPKKRGPKGAYKLTAEVVDFIEKAGDDIPGPKAAELARQVHERFGLSLHPRSIEKALARKKKERLP